MPQLDFFWEYIRLWVWFWPINNHRKPRFWQTNTNTQQRKLESPEWKPVGWLLCFHWWWLGPGPMCWTSGRFRCDFECRDGCKETWDFRWYDTYNYSQYKKINTYTGYWSSREWKLQTVTTRSIFLKQMIFTDFRFHFFSESSHLVLHGATPIPPLARFITLTTQSDLSIKENVERITSLTCRITSLTFHFISGPKEHPTTVPCE